MSKFGNWEVKFSPDKYPQKVASAISNFNEELLGASYKFIAYLAEQPVNGINHALLAQQTILTGKDVDNAVIVVLNEKTNSNDLSLAEIRCIVENGGELGGTKVDITLDIPDEAKDLWAAAFKDFVGSKIEALAYIGAKSVKGLDHKFLAKVTPVVPNGKAELSLVTINSLDKKTTFETVL